MRYTNLRFTYLLTYLPIYKAHRAVIFVVAQLSCYVLGYW